MTHDDLNIGTPGNELPVLLTERDLARRWRLSCRTLQRWRAERYGPAWIWIGGSIRYRFSDIEGYEARNRKGARADE